MKELVKVRAAQQDDVEAIFELLELYVAQGIVLRRSKEDISFLSVILQWRKSAGVFAAVPPSEISAVICLKSVQLLSHLNVRGKASAELWLNI